MIKKLITTLGLAAAICLPLHASPDTVVVSDRLSNQRVNKIAEDRYGHIWMATGRGLNKFDGQQFHQYFRTGPQSGLPDNQIWTIFSSSDGRLWVGTVLGAAYRTGTGEFHRVKSARFYNNIAGIWETPDGDILFSNTENLLRYDAATDSLCTVVREFNAFGAEGTILSRDGRIWTLTAGGTLLQCYNTRTFAIEASIPIPYPAYHLCEMGAELWLSGMGQLSVIDRQTRQPKPLPEAIRKDARLMGGDIDLLFPVDDGNLLMNVIGKGFFLYNRTRGNVLFQADDGFPYQIPDAEIRTLLKDSYGNLWFGTTDQGYSVSYANQSLFKANKALTAAFAGKTVTSVCPDLDGNLWIATLRNGLFCYDLTKKTLHSVDVSAFIPDSNVGYIRSSRIYCDPTGEIWLLFGDKVRVIGCRWDGKKLRQQDFFYRQNPMSIMSDDQGCIWVGGFGGALTRYDPRTKEAREVPILPEGEWTFVTDLIMREPGRLVAACFNRIPMEINTYTMETRQYMNGVTAFEMDTESSIHIPTTLFMDSERNLWVGTTASGLYVDNAQTSSVSAIPGAPCPDICAIQEDLQGNIWVSTMDGLGKYDRTVNRFVHYFEEDGTGGDQYSERASCILPDGTLIFGGTHGLTCFHPLDVSAKRSVPLVFEDLIIHNQLVQPSPDGPINKELCEKPQVTIKHEENGFSISFAALDYSEFEQVRYAYMLEGFNQYWVKIGTSRQAHFSNLPAGNYKFRVRIKNASHTITETEESIDIKVLPAWYQTWWAKTLFALAGILVLAMSYTYYRHIRRVRKEAARHIREVRREKEKAEEAEKAEKELNKIQMNYFSNVAHEFRTPLTMIAGPAQQLSESEGIQGQDRKLVDIIRRNTTWMLSLVNQLLDFNRIGNSKLQLKVAKMDIVEPLRDIASLFRFNAQSKRIDLNTYGLEDSFTMWVDADKVQKVVMNLLSNALKFTPSGGKASLSFDVIPREEAAARFPLTEADKDGQWAIISVADSGPGIPEDQLEKIFERFYQSEAGKKMTGSGIGLYYARALSTLHHGYIKAWNREEGGACFGLALPVSASSYTEDERTVQEPQLPAHALAESITADTPEEEGAKRHIVVVDDDIDIANYLKVMLKPQYKVSLYFDAVSALKGMEEDAPDLIISDVMMPGMDGYELCSRIKGDLQLSHIPVVLVTAKVAVESQVQGLDKGADAYVTKPFQPAYLMALVKSLLENREKLHRQLGSVTTTEEIEPEALSPRDASFMKELYELMEKELTNTDLDITRITEMMKISRTKFYYKVKGLTGENPSVFFKRYKLNRAADLLKEGKFNMSEIAYMTGFNTLSHFSTSFKKQFGVPPSEYVG